MPRAVLFALLLGCSDTSDASDPTTDAGSEASGVSDTGAPAETTSGGASTTTAASTDGSTTGPDPTVPVPDGSTGDSICATPYAWGAAESKDILVVLTVDAAIVDPDPVHALAQSLASDAGHHIAVAAAATGNEPTPGNGYEPLTLPPGTDPLEIATGVALGDGFRRAHTPLRLVVVADTDTAWDDAMLRAARDAVRWAQLDARVILPDVSGCDALGGLTDLTLATFGSLSCTTQLDPADILDDDVLGEQPACMLAPDGEIPPLGSGDVTLGLHGIAPAGPQAEFPTGPEACRTSPSSWSGIDGDSGAVGLCPARCRSVGVWYVSERLTAEVGYPCPD